MSGDLSAVAFTASLPLQLVIFHLVKGHMTLMAINASHTPAFMDTAFPRHSLQFTHILFMTIHTGLVMEFR